MKILAIIITLYFGAIIYKAYTLPSRQELIAEWRQNERLSRQNLEHGLKLLHQIEIDMKRLNLDNPN